MPRDGMTLDDANDAGKHGRVYFVRPRRSRHHRLSSLPRRTAGEGERAEEIEDRYDADDGVATTVLNSFCGWWLGSIGMTQ